jgi:predicted ester cyclase
MTPEETKAKVRWWIEEFNKRNLDAAGEIYSKDCLFHPLPGPDYKGLDTYKERVASLLTTAPDLKMTIDEIMVEGNSRASRATLSGTHTGQSAAFPIPPTGKKAVWTVCYVSHTDGEKVVEQWEFADNLGLFQQLGLIPSM